VKAGTLAAIDDFVRRHPQSHLDTDIKAARHAVYQAALDRYLQQAPTKSPAELAFMERLVAWAELKGPPVEIRFRLFRHFPKLELLDSRCFLNLQYLWTS